MIKTNDELSIKHLSNESIPVYSRRGTSIFRTNVDEVRTVVGEDGKDYIVAPVVAIKEGVLNGEKVTGEVIKNSVVYWDKVPVTVNHPKVNGEFVSVKNSEVTDQIIGFLTNTIYSGHAHVTVVGTVRHRSSQSFTPSSSVSGTGSQSSGKPSPLQSKSHSSGTPFG